MWNTGESCRIKLRPIWYCHSSVDVATVRPGVYCYLYSPANNNVENQEKSQSKITNQETKANVNLTNGVSGCQIGHSQAKPRKLFSSKLR
jgi:hypothetical protein